MLRILPREVGPDGNDWNNPGELCFCEACPEDLAEFSPRTLLLREYYAHGPLSRKWHGVVISSTSCEGDDPFLLKMARRACT